MVATAAGVFMRPRNSWMEARPASMPRIIASRGARVKRRCTMPSFGPTQDARQHTTALATMVNRRMPALLCLNTRAATHTPR